ncbi:MAG: hypothetical protein AAFN13_04515 [Bacteroidota bacterium]
MTPFVRSLFSSWALAAVLVGGLLLASAPEATAQFQNRWLSAGSFHNWYSEVGSERELGFRSGGEDQQYGWRWPAIFADRNLLPATDMQAAKGLWIGATNVTADGFTYPARVVHVGPRVNGVGEFFPVQFDLISKREPTVVSVDGIQTFSPAEMVVDEVDPTIPADYMYINKANTLLGLTMERRIMQFSQDYHDNYHVIEYTFTNTGNTDGDPEIEQPNQTLEGVIIFLQNRLSVVRETRFVIGDNPTGWGKHTMNDARGDGVRPDPEGEQFRAQFSWHGNFPPFTIYDNIGGPILPARAPATFVAASDTSGRLAGSAFAGTVTLFAEGTPDSGMDDFSQPATTTWFGSDDPFTSNNDAFSPGKMQQEYDLMASGHRERHAYVVEPTGLPGWLNPTGDPSLNTPGGMSYANGYGPYTLAPGESIRFVIAEGAAGLSRQATIDIGRAWKEADADPAALITYTVGGQEFTKTKNEWVFTSQDSLMQTFRRAIANFESGYDIPQSPAPPATFDVTGGGDRISLAWTSLPGEPDPDRWEIYRSRVRFDSTATLIHTAEPGERFFDDTTPIRGVEYYYYIQAIDDDASDGSALSPAGALRSSRYFTQTYTPTRLKREQGRQIDGFAIVPNPFSISSQSGQIRFPGFTDQLAFYDIPGFCRIDIYTELGELVDSIEHNDGSGDEFWDHTTSSRQTIVSGIYIAVVTVTQDIPDPNSTTGELLFRNGEQSIKKFVVIR